MSFLCLKFCKSFLNLKRFGRQIVNCHCEWSHKEEGSEQEDSEQEDSEQEDSGQEDSGQGTNMVMTNDSVLTPD